MTSAAPGERRPDQFLVSGFSELSPVDYMEICKILGMFGLQLHETEVVEVGSDTVPEALPENHTWKTREAMLEYINASRWAPNERLMNQSWNSLLRMHDLAEKFQAGIRIQRDELENYQHWIAAGIQLSKVDEYTDRRGFKYPTYAVSIESIYDSLHSGKFMQLPAIGGVTASLWLNFAVDTLPEEKRDLEWEGATPMLRGRRLQARRTINRRPARSGRSMTRVQPTEDYL